MKVLVTGGAGFIGSHIVEELVSNHMNVVIVDNLSTGHKEFIPENIRYYQLNIQSPEIEEVFKKEKPDYVIHQAAQVDVSKSINNPLQDAQTNILGTINLLKYCHKYGVKKVIYASSCAIYGETTDVSIKENYPIKPISFYGLSKYTPELYIHLFHELYGLPFVILRYANVYGPRQTPKGEGGAVSIFITKLLNGETPVIFGSGEQTRDFVFVKDVARANVLALLHGMNETINISCNQKTSITQLYQLITSKISVLILPTFLQKRNGDILYSRLDNTKAAKKINWEPIFDLEKGLVETITFYKKHLRKDDN